MPMSLDQALHNLSEAAKECRDAKVHAESLRAKAKLASEKFWNTDATSSSAAAVRIELMTAEKEAADATDIFRRAADKLMRAVQDFVSALIH